MRSGSQGTGPARGDPLVPGKPPEPLERAIVQQMSIMRNHEKVRKRVRVNISERSPFCQREFAEENKNVSAVCSQGAVGRLPQAYAGVIGRQAFVAERGESRFFQGYGEESGQGPVLHDAAA